MIRSLEELAFNAWPSLQTMHYDGWALRFADGYTRRANSVNPIYPSTLPLIEKIQCCEEVYRRKQQETIFKMTSAVQPEDLEDVLGQRCYRKEAETSVQTLHLNDPARKAVVSEGMALSPSLTEEWVDDFCALHRQTLSRRAVMVRMLGSIVPETAYATLKEHGETVAVGLAVREGGWIGLFDIVTHSQQRGQGYATRLIGELLRWGRSQGAERAYLQVMLDNDPALNLYRKLGFAEAYRYWYRIKGR